ncbi:MAG: hypothetical protein PWQ57_3052 [Desulfovibrionales bacterium]|nr:hypothetical protein [Desulfovibrionales bacterium]
MARRLLLPILLMFFNLLATIFAHAYRGGGYGMGPGMMYGQGGQGYGMGSGMMYGPGYVWDRICADMEETPRNSDKSTKCSSNTLRIPIPCARSILKKQGAWLRSFSPRRRTRPRCTSWPSRSKPFGQVVRCVRGFGIEDVRQGAGWLRYGIRRYGTWNGTMHDGAWDVCLSWRRQLILVVIPWLRGACGADGFPQLTPQAQIPFKPSPYFSPIM